MWWSDYIREIQRQFIEVYDIPEKPGLPIDIPDGNYPMTIDGKISCCNFESEPAQ